MFNDFKEKGMHRRISRICISFAGFILLGTFLIFLNACGDSGDRVIDEATGNRALKQYEMTKDKVKKIEEKQQEKYKDILPGAMREEKPDE
jgi:hypothetical protein